MQSADLQHLDYDITGTGTTVSNLVALKVGEKGYFRPLIPSQIIPFFMYKRTDIFVVNRIGHSSVVILPTAEK